ncbi:MAG: hypothetical protein IV094_07210 [Vitreoscilla sp.]|nr:hypothetical protein [Vitreoscilla sp.]
MTKTLFAAAALATILSPLAAQAQSAEVFIEKSKIVGGGAVIHLYGLPTKDSLGKARYYDATVTFTADPVTGKLSKTADVVAVGAAKVKTAEFVPGVYTFGTSTTCNLVPSAFQGRTQFDLHCGDTGTNTFTATWFTGLIAGHPYETELTTASLDTIPGNNEYAWGRVGYDGNATWLNNCFNDPELFSARQVGDILTLVNYGNNTSADCQASLTRVP